MTRLRQGSRLRQGYGGQAGGQSTGGRAGGQGTGERQAPSGSAYIAALNVLSRREISAAALRTRLQRRGFPLEEIDEALQRLTRDGTLNDARTASAAARLEGAIRLRGRRRVLQKMRALGIEADVAEAAVEQVFADLDENALLDRAIARRLRGQSAETLDRAGTARLVRALVGQGFAPDAIFRRLRYVEPTDE